jgi:hypothetical protein
MLLIYTHQLTPRNHYIFDLLLNQILGIAFEVTNDVDAFLKSSNPKLNYSKARFADEFFIESVALLFEKDLAEQKITVSNWNDLKIFFQTTENSAIPFDVFAAAFYLVSRYEEYLSYAADKYGRYVATDSLAFQNNFLQTPLVNKYAHLLKGLLLKLYPQLQFKEQQYQFVSTIDIDNAYAFIGKGFYRTAGALVRSFINGDTDAIKERMAALQFKTRDIYDTYDYYFDLQKEFQFQSVFFFLLGDFTRYDKNLPHHSSRFQQLIKRIATEAQYGLHPSYTSNGNQKQLQKEVMRLQKITGEKVTKSRQHFLKLTMPQSYQSLIAAGITNDYTMGYADVAGFRASICTSFLFFDLSKNETTSLLIHPFAVMDATLNKYMNLMPDDAILVVQKLITEVRNVNGTFMSLWHNETLSETGIWKGWRTVFEFTIKQASANN